MYRRIFYVLIFSLSVSLVFLAGCEQAYEEQAAAEELVEGPPIITKEVVSDYIDGALSATGGRDLWLQAKEIEYDCVVTFYKPDGTFYLTKHHHLIEPWSRRIRISATEPRGRFVCEFTPGLFKILEGAVSKKGLPQGLCERELAEALLEAVSGPVSFLDKSEMFTRMANPIRKEGLWYYVIERIEPSDLISVDSKEVKAVGPVFPYWSRIFYYQRADSLLVDMLWFANFERQEYIGVRCYDYKGIVKRDVGFERTGVFIPRKVELFRTDSKGVFHDKIAEMDIKNCSYVSF